MTDKPTYEELEQRVDELERKVARHEAFSKGLKESEGKLNAMLESIGDHISMVDRELNIIWANETAKKLFGGNMVGKKCFEVYHKKHSPCDPHPCITLQTLRDGKTHSHDTQAITAGGTPIHLHCTTSEVRRDKNARPTAVIKISRDITKDKVMEASLRKREAELEDKSNHLTEANTALKVLLKQRENDKKALEENILSHVKQLVRPNLETLKGSRLNDDQMALVDTLESNLNNIVSPLAGRLSSKYLDLTPREIRVADFVKEGRTNKEIAQLLGVSKSTVLTHRHHLREKLSLKYTKTNLRSYLASLGQY